MAWVGEFTGQLGALGLAGGGGGVPWASVDTAAAESPVGF